MLMLDSAGVVAIRQLGTQNYAYEDDAGDLDFGPPCARTMFFDPGDEALYAHMSAAPGGHESVEEVPCYLTVITESF